MLNPTALPRLLLLLMLVGVTAPRDATAQDTCMIGEENCRELDGRDLRGLDLSGLSLVGVNLLQANLGGANLSHADLSGVDLRGANLSEANLSGANLTGAKLTSAFLIGANLSGANLTRAELSYAVLDGADLTRADLTDATVTYARIRVPSTKGVDADMWEAKKGSVIWDPTFRLNLAIETYRWGNAALARSDLVAIIEEDPPSGSNLSDPTGKAMATLALIDYREQRWADAAETADRYLTFVPADETMMRTRWSAYRRVMGSTTDAAALAAATQKEQAAWDAYATAHPGVALVDMYYAGEEQYNVGDVQDAIASFERVLALDADHAYGHYRLGLCFVSAGRTPEARTHLARFLELAPDDPEAPGVRDMLSYLN